MYDYIHMNYYAFHGRGAVLGVDLNKPYNKELPLKENLIDAYFWKPAK